MSSIVFWTLMGIVCLSPLPLASNRPLPWSLLSFAVGALLLVWAASRMVAAFTPDRTATASNEREPAGRGPGAPSVDRYAAVLVAGFAVLMLWYWIQATPGLRGAWTHPAWAEAAAVLGEPLAGAISLDPAAGETLLMKILAYGGILLLALDLGRDRGRARSAYALVSLSGLAYALYGLWVHFTGTGTVLWFAKDAYPESVTATFVNRNAYATYAGMTIVAGLAVLLSEVRRLRGDRVTAMRLLRALSERAPLLFYVVAAAILTGATAVIMTGSRAGTVCLLLALATFGVCMLIGREIRLRTFLAGATVGVLGIVAVLSLSGGFLAKRLSTDTVPDARTAIFDVARASVTAEPWTGHGLGAFGPAFNRANDGRAVFETYVDLAHNAYLELAVEGGVPALLLSLALIGSCVGICFSGLFARDRASSVAIGAVAIAVLVGGHAMVDFGVQMPAVAANFMLLIGVGAAQALLADQAMRSDAPEVARPEGRWRSPRRRRFGLERPHSADEAVTPPPTLDMAWPQRAEPPDLSRHGRASAPKGEPADTPDTADILPPRRPSPPAEPAGDDYETAMARWRAVQPPEEHAAARPASTDPRTGPAVASAPSADGTSEPPPPGGPPGGTAQKRPGNVVALPPRPPKS
jgi:O-antigen ligase